MVARGDGVGGWGENSEGMKNYKLIKGMSSTA